MSGRKGWIESTSLEHAWRYYLDSEEYIAIVPPEALRSNVRFQYQFWFCCHEFYLTTWKHLALYDGKSSDDFSPTTSIRFDSLEKAQIAVESFVSRVNKLKAFL